MALYDTIKAHLEKYPNARERKNKNRFIAWLLWSGLKGQVVTKEMLEQFVVDASSYDRAWRQVLQLEPHLRGSDYGEKRELEEAKQLELGYEPGHAERSKQINSKT